MSDIGYKYLVIGMILFSMNLFAQSIHDLIPKNQPYFIQSALTYGKKNFGYWDLPGGEKDIRKGAKIKVWELSDKAKDRRYVIVNSSNKAYLKIQLDGINGYVDVEGGRNDNGTDLRIWDPNNSNAQNFRFDYLGNGKFRIFSANGKVVCTDGRKYNNGTQVQIWDDHPGAWTEWYLIDTRTNKTLKLEDKISAARKNSGPDMSGARNVYIQSAQEYGKGLKGCWDVPGRNYPEKGKSLKVWELQEDDADRKFDVISSGSDFTSYSISIAGNGNLLADVTNNGKANGTDLIVWERNNGPAQNYKFKHLGDGRFKIYSDNGKVLCLNGRISENGTNVHIWQDHDGPWTEWYLVDYNTNKPFIPGKKDMVPSSLSSVSANAKGANAKTLATNIDQLYSRLNDLQNKSGSTLSSSKSADQAVTGLYDISESFNRLNSRFDDVADALTAFRKMPFIGTAVTALSQTFGAAKDKINSGNSAISSMRKPVIDPMRNNVLNTNISVRSFNSQMQAVKLDLLKLKKNLGSMNENQCAIVNQKISEINNSLASADKELSAIKDMSGKVKVINKPVSNAKKGIDKFDNGFKKVDKVADEINKVLNKKFEKKVFGKKFSISLRKVLEGGKVGKAFKKFVDKWVSKLTKPLTKKLNIKLPSVPSVDKLKGQAQSVLDFTKNMKKNSDNLKAIISKVANADSDIRKTAKLSDK